jgi:hypothetical protein
MPGRGQPLEGLLILKTSRIVKVKIRTEDRQWDDFCLVVFQRGNNDFCLFGIRTRKRLGTVPERLLREPEMAKLWIKQ